MVDQIIQAYGRIDVLFNNARISGVGLLHEIEPEAWDKVINVNIRGVFLTSKYVLPHMIEVLRINYYMSSCIAEMGLARRASYAATKGAVLALTKSMQVDYAPYHIRVNALLPGTIMTPFVEDYLKILMMTRQPQSRAEEAAALRGVVFSRRCSISGFIPCF